MLKGLAAILPSRDEATTIAQVASCAAHALKHGDATVVHVDASCDEETVNAFQRASLPCATISLKLFEAGKGRQIVAGLRSVPDAEIVLVIDTDTKNPSVETYSSLVAAVGKGATLAVADYPRFWHEGNLTNHLVRPLLAGTIGANIRQPIAGDYALSKVAVNSLLNWIDTSAIADSAREYINGYGIDAAIVLNSLSVGSVVSVQLDDVKRHAASFPHFRSIFFDEMAVLLAVLQRNATYGSKHHFDESYSIMDDRLSDERYNTMLATMDLWLRDINLSSIPPLAHAVSFGLIDLNYGNCLDKVLARIWPAYVWHSKRYIMIGQSQGLDEARRYLIENCRYMLKTLRETKTLSSFKKSFK